MELENIYLYRMTHLDNIPDILEKGIVHKNSPNSNSNFIPIGDVSLIDTRSTKTVNVDNGDRSNSNPQTITLGNFIPFYFGIKMPMLYVIQNGGNFVQQPIPPEKIIYLVCPVNRLIQSGGNYYFSDGHATDRLTSFYDKSKINDLPHIIDWRAIKKPFWGGHENLDIKRKKQAEFLVADDLPPEYIVGFCCYNQKAKETLIKMRVEAKIKIVPQAYY